MQLLVWTDAEPDMLLVFEGMRDPPKTQGLFIEFRALLQVAYVHRSVVKLQTMG
jgi:hypothetical protein